MLSPRKTTSSFCSVSAQHTTYEIYDRFDGFHLRLVYFLPPPLFLLLALAPDSARLRELSGMQVHDIINTCISDATVTARFLTESDHHLAKHINEYDQKWFLRSQGCPGSQHYNSSRFSRLSAAFFKAVCSLSCKPCSSLNAASVLSSQSSFLTDTC